MQLRPYQEESIRAVESALSRGIKRQMIQLPTGCGKTVVFCALLHQMGLRGLVVAHRDELLSQAKETALKWNPELCPSIFGQDDLSQCRTLISSIQLAIQPKRLEVLKIFSPKVIVIDECHHAPAPSYQKLIEELEFDRKGTLLFGVTATPTRLDGLGMRRVFTDLVYKKTIVEMVELGYLCPIKAQVVRTGIDLSCLEEESPQFYILKEAYDEGAAKEKDFTDKAVSAAINTDLRNSLIVDSYLEKCLDRKHTIAFCADVQHSISLAEMFIRKGVLASASYGSMNDDDRRKNIEDFKEGKIKVLTNCNLYTEGFDFPALDCVLMTRPTKSKALYTQCVGRGTRKHPGKDDCFVLDFRDDLKALICTFADMDDREKRGASPYEEKDPDAEAQEGKPINKSDGTLYYSELDLFQNVYDKQRLPPTQSQINQLINGYPNREFDFEAMTRKEASSLIGTVELTPKQLNFLKWKKWPNPENLTKWEAQKIIGQIMQGEKDEEKIPPSF